MEITNEIYDQKQVIELLKNMSYEYISEDECIKVRKNKLKDVLLKDILKENLKKINSYEYKGIKYEFSEKNIEDAIEKLDVSLEKGLMSANAEITDFLYYGTTLEEKLNDGTKKSFSFKYIDWKDFEKNSFYFTEEFEVEKMDLNGKEKHKRPDIVIFINGIPLASIELKKSSVVAEEGISQTIRNQREDNIPHFFKFTQLLMAGNTHEFRYGTTGTPTKFWAVWNEEEDLELELKNLINDRMVNKLDQNIYSLLKKDRFVDLLYQYTLFDNKVKKVARYQQYYAIKKTLKRIEKIDLDGSRHGGLIWHTQGSGKSLTMVMLAKAIQRKIHNAKIIIVTDRKALDQQIKDTFKATEVDVVKASSGSELSKLLKGDRSAVITTVVNKFESVANENIVLNNPNIFILVDESHRTQYGSLNAKMKKTFPLGCFIGLTGTPLMKKEKSSIDKFGGMIHKYTIDSAVKDKAVLPLLYDGRLVEQNITNESGLNRRFDILAKGLNDEQKEDLKAKWSKFSQVASSETRLWEIAMDINEHYKNNWQNTGFKAMFATSSKYEAVKYHQIFEQIGEIKTAFIISPPDDREGNEEVEDENKSLVVNEWKKILNNYGDEERYETAMKDELKSDHGIEILIVVDKLLTGFDAPRATTLYLDKELKDHTLLQAIARVNRLFDEKDYGYIIDYRGLLGNLDRALTTYSTFQNFDEEDISGSLIDIKEEISRVKSYYAHLQEFFIKIKNKNDREEYEVYLEDNKLRKEFYNLLKEYSKALKYSLSSEKVYDYLGNDLDRYKKSLKFYNDLRASIRIRYHEAIDFGKFEKEMQKMLDTFIDATGVSKLSKVVDIFNVEFAKEVERLEGKRAKADTIRSAVSKTISEKYEENPALYKPLSDKIKQTLEEYKSKRISEDDYLKSMEEILDILKSGASLKKESHPKLIKDNFKAQKLYENIKMLIGEELIGMNDISYNTNISKNSSDELEVMEDVSYNSTILLSQLAIDFDKVFLENCKVDWSKNPTIHDKLYQKLQDLLWNLEDSCPGVEFDNDTIIEKVMMIAQSMY